MGDIMIGDMSLNGAQREMSKALKKMVGCELDRQGICKQTAKELTDEIVDKLMTQKRRNWNDPDFLKNVEKFKKNNTLPEVGLRDTLNEIWRGRQGREKNKALIRFVSERLWKWVTSKTDQPYKEAYREMNPTTNSAPGVRG